MKRIVELVERNYADKDTYADAPVDYEDAIENYKRILDITGDVAANVIEPNSEDVDIEGPHLENGQGSMLPRPSRILIPARQDFMAYPCPSSLRRSQPS